jgi:hypothetical protein
MTTYSIGLERNDATSRPVMRRTSNRADTPEAASRAVGCMGELPRGIRSIADAREGA